MNSCIATPDQGVEESWAIVADDQILRSESYSVEHLEQHSLYLARLFKMATKSADDGCFTARFAKNANFLRQAYASISDSIQVGEPLTPDAEWILDNFYIVEEQLREIREDLPDQFYRELPKLTTGEPRVYALAIELITHTDSALDEERIIRFVREFQTITPLSIGEVWAVPIMLRLGLVENLRRLSAQMLAARRCRFEAQEILDIWKKRGELTIDLSSLERCAPLVLKLLTQMQEKDSPFAGGLKELERRLTEHNLSAHDAVHFEHQRQAANQVSIGNVITSMRLISALDWVLFFEQTNLAEQVLRQDPAEVYPRMDFETRDRYRHAVEELAKRTKLTDIDVAERTVALAQQTESTAQDHWQQRHVGYWLVDRGRVDLEKLLSYKPPLRQRFNLWLLRHPNSTYFCSVGFLTALGVSAAALGAMLFGASLLVVFVICLLAILPASELAVSLVNLAVTSWLKPRLLPKLEFKEGIPSTYPTMVVVPAMLTNPREVESLVSRLEMHYLTNPEAALRFALLTDFSDAPQHEMSEDSSLVKAAIGGIRELNRRYGEETGGPFYLFHRERRWNERERKWMGWERKRGKLMEFNQLLRGRTDTSYVVQEGDMPQLVGRDGHASIQFVITLDADTQLPHGVARKLIGALAHPLNRPCYDASRHLVTSGYGVLQPRVSVHLGSANKTWFSRIFADSPGIDPYTTCASDMYQDLFGEGSFTGKGIYDLDAFEKALDGVFPENQILSHDLIEGCHARVGLVSDIVLIDGFPALYEADAKRQHRWVRGDWQLLPWLFPKVPTATGWRQNPLTLLSRWKVFDNLRRSLVAPAVMALLVVGWMILPNGAALWTLAGLLILAFPLAAQIFMIVRGWQPDAPWWDHVQAVWRDLWRTPVQTVLAVAFLPHKAYFMLDAVVRTLTRMLVTRRRLLEWETAAESEKRLSGNRWASLLRMCYVPGVAIAVLCLINSMAWPAAAPLLLSWLVAPLLVFWIDRPIRRRTSALTTDQLQQLRHVTRRTWAFFEAYVGAQDHWLPPDNFQEYPGEKIAHRVSPTNQGLFLISGLVARDFGYISLHHLAQLWERNLESWEKFERLHGHFYNWYDTSTLTPLYPRYVSTVDSGNLAVFFI